MIRIEMWGLHNFSSQEQHRHALNRYIIKHQLTNNEYYPKYLKSQQRTDGYIN